MKPGDKMRGHRSRAAIEEGYYELSLIHVEQPKDWSSLEKRSGGEDNHSRHCHRTDQGRRTVDVGMRAFMPASRSGARDAAEMAEAGRPGNRLQSHQG